MGKLTTVGHWVVLLAGRRRCWACSRLYLLHLPWQVSRNGQESSWARTPTLADEHGAVGW